MKQFAQIGLCLALSGCVEPNGNYLFPERSVPDTQDYAWRLGACQQLQIDGQKQQKPISTEIVAGLQQRSVALQCGLVAPSAAERMRVPLRTTGLTECIADCYQNTGRWHAFCEETCNP